MCVGYKKFYRTLFSPNMDCIGQIGWYIELGCASSNTLIYLIGINFRRFFCFDKIRENLYLRKMAFWKILSFLGNFGDFCSISMANLRNIYTREIRLFLSLRKFIPIRYMANVIYIGLNSIL